jgi:predicted dehydrogenase
MLKLGIRCWSSRKKHLRLLQQSEKYELVGFYDPNQENADKISKIWIQTF